jgi:aryl-alcohol dehydrogenase-like predicted oxidoreductase
MHSLRPFGSSGLTTSALGLGSSYGLGSAGVVRAFERGLNFFLWGSLRKRSFGEGLRELARTHRAEMVVAVQSYARLASLLEWSVDRALRPLGVDYVDILCLAWWNGPAPARILDAARRLRDKGKVRHLMVSSHHRPNFERFIGDPTFDAIMLRYSAAHTGAEREVFPLLQGVPRRPGVVAFTATRWGTLLDPRLTPAGEKTPSATDCYRFALTNPHVDVVLSGPQDEGELDGALLALEKGALDSAELAWMRRVGAHVHDGAPKPRRTAIFDAADKIAARYQSCSRSS